jgi:hypothetical protein
MRLIGSGEVSMKHTLFLSSSLLLLLALGCTSGERRAVKGRLDTSQFRLESARVLAIGSDGHRYKSDVQADGSFRLSLPVDARYEIRFANSTTGAGVFDAFAILIDRDKSGVMYRTIALSSGPEIDLGLVRREGNASRGLRALTDDGEEDDEDSSSESSDDDSSSDSEDSDSDSDSEVSFACDLSGGSDLEAVESEHGLLTSVDSDGDGSSDADDPPSDGRCDDDDDCSSCESEAAESGEPAPGNL